MTPFETSVPNGLPKPTPKPVRPFVSSSGKGSGSDPDSLPTVTLAGFEGSTVEVFAELTLDIVREIALSFNTSEQRVLGYMVEHLHTF